MAAPVKICFQNFVLVPFIAARWQHHTKIFLENFVLVSFIAARWQHHTKISSKICISSLHCR
jgi:hypothetical protein